MNFCHSKLAPEQGREPHVYAWWLSQSLNLQKKILEPSLISITKKITTSYMIPIFSACFITIEYKSFLTRMLPFNENYFNVTRIILKMIMYKIRHGAKKWLDGTSLISLSLKIILGDCFVLRINAKVLVKVVFHLELGSPFQYLLRLRKT